MLVATAEVRERTTVAGLCKVYEGAGLNVHQHHKAATKKTKYAQLMESLSDAEESSPFQELADICKFF